MIRSLAAFVSRFARAFYAAPCRAEYLAHSILRWRLLVLANVLHILELVLCGVFACQAPAHRTHTILTCKNGDPVAAFQHRVPVSHV